MKYLFWVMVIIVLMGCNSSVKDAKANRTRQAIRRINEKHELAMADSKALTPVRRVVKEILLWSLMVSGVIVSLSIAGSVAWVFVGTSFYHIRDRRIQQVSLDIETRQYPLLMYGNGRRIYNPNNGERLLLSDISEAQANRIEASTKVQLAGLLPERIIDSELA